jgi:hypothetical protein
MYHISTSHYVIIAPYSSLIENIMMYGGVAPLVKNYLFKKDYK